MIKNLLAKVKTRTYLFAAPFFTDGKVLTERSTKIKGDSLKLFIDGLSTVLVSIAGSLALLFIIYAGFQMIVSRGNAQQYESAKKTLTNAIIGLLLVVLVMVAYNLIVNFADIFTAK